MNSCHDPFVWFLQNHRRIGHLISRVDAGSLRRRIELLGSGFLCHWILKKGHSKGIDHYLMAGDHGSVKISRLAVESIVHPLVHKVASAVKDSQRIELKAEKNLK